MSQTAEEQFKRDFIIKLLVQEEQFVQWLKIFFFISDELEKVYNTVYQDTFYLKFHELLNDGKDYAQKVYKHLQQGSNANKTVWYSKLLSGLSSIESALTGIELDYVEYRRHNVCHIFQNSYEVIQDNLKIKKHRNKKDLYKLNQEIMALIAKFGSDKSIDEHLMKKLRPIITDLFSELK